MSNLLKNILFSALIVSATSSCLANPTATVDISQLPPAQTAADLQMFEAVNFNIMGCAGDECGYGGALRESYPLAELGLVDQMLFQETSLTTLFKITNDLAMLSPDLISNNTELWRIIQEILNNILSDSEFIKLHNNIEKDPKITELRAKIAAGELSKNESKIEQEKIFQQMLPEILTLAYKLIDKHTSSQNFNIIKKIYQPALDLLEIKQEFECPSELCIVFINKAALRCAKNCVTLVKPSIDHAELLINADTTNIKAVDANGRTILMHHLMGDVASPKIIKLLIDKGVNVQAVSNEGETALSIARAYDHPVVILEQLINAGAK